MRAYEAKRAFFDRLHFEQDELGNFEGIGISYDDPPSDLPLNIYGGGVRWTTEDPHPELFAGQLVNLTVSLGVYFEAINRPAGRNAIRGTDETVEAMVRALAMIMAANPTLDHGEDFRFLGMTDGQGDYESNQDMDRSVMGVQVQIRVRVNNINAD